jgi:hypothetical protein
MVAHTCNPSSWKVVAGGLLVWGQPGLHSKSLYQNKQTKCNNNWENNNSLAERNRMHSIG